MFQLVTLPVEFNASRRAIASLEGTHLLEDDELRGARKVLEVAAMTYVAPCWSPWLNCCGSCWPLQDDGGIR
ncbi:MAG: zinc metallopeptidase [Flavonifractor plautii]